MKVYDYVHKVLVGLLLRCPYCEQGRMFSGLFHMNETCPHCGARFQRAQGDSLGGMMLNLVIAEVLSMGGFIVSELLFHPGLAFHLIVWGSFNLLFVIFFYRHAHGAWTGVAYLMGGVYPDKTPETLATKTD